MDEGFKCIQKFVLLRVHCSKKQIKYARIQQVSYINTMGIPVGLLNSDKYLSYYCINGSL